VNSRKKDEYVKKSKSLKPQMKKMKAWIGHSMPIRSVNAEAVVEDAAAAVGDEKTMTKKIGSVAGAVVAHGVPIHSHHLSFFHFHSSLDRERQIMVVLAEVLASTAVGVVDDDAPPMCSNLMIHAKACCLHTHHYPHMPLSALSWAPRPKPKKTAVVVVVAMVYAKTTMLSKMVDVGHSGAKVETSGRSDIGSGSGLNKGRPMARKTKQAADGAVDIAEND